MLNYKKKIIIHYLFKAIIKLPMTRKDIYMLKERRRGRIDS